MFLYWLYILVGTPHLRLHVHWTVTYRIATMEWMLCIICNNTLVCVRNGQRSPHMRSMVTAIKGRHRNKASITRKSNAETEKIQNNQHKWSQNLASLTDSARNLEREVNLQRTRAAQTSQERRTNRERQRHRKARNNVATNTKLYLEQWPHNASTVKPYASLTNNWKWKGKIK